MVTHNDITGDLVRSRPNSKDYNDNYDKIFNKDNIILEDKGLDINSRNSIWFHNKPTSK